MGSNEEPSHSAGAGESSSPEADQVVRVAFFSPLTIEHKSAELWCEIPATKGREFGIDGTSFAAPLPRLVESIHGLWARRTLPGRIAWAFYWFAILLPLRLGQLVRIGRFDVVFVNLTMFRIRTRPILEKITRAVFGRPLVLHISDAYWVRYPRERIEERCRVADLVVTGNEYTADFARSAGGTVRKVEYGLDAGLYPVKDHSGERGLVIGVTGTTADTFPSEAAEGIARACDESESRFVWVGSKVRPDIPVLDPLMEWRTWDERNPHGFFTEFDIAVCPLDDDEWTRGKETFKIKEYMAAGLPQVLSPVGYGLEVIEDGVEGFFAGSAEEWFDRLTILIGDPDLRARMGSAARNRLESVYGSERMLAGIGEVCREAAALKGSPRPAR